MLLGTFYEDNICLSTILNTLNSRYCKNIYSKAGSACSERKMLHVSQVDVCEIAQENLANKCYCSLSSGAKISVAPYKISFTHQLYIFSTITQSSTACRGDCTKLRQCRYYPEPHLTQPVWSGQLKLSRITSSGRLLYQRLLHHGHLASCTSLQGPLQGSFTKLLIRGRFSQPHFVCMQPLRDYQCRQPLSQLVLAHSSPSGRFIPGKIADFLGLLDHACTLLKINITKGLYLCYHLQKTEPLYHIYNPFQKHSKFENLNFSI